MLLALILAVMPLFMAVPVRADVLSDVSGPSAGIYFDDSFYPLPDFDFDFLFVFSSASDGQPMFYFSNDANVSRVYITSGSSYQYINFDVDPGVYAQWYSFADGQWVLKGNKLFSDVAATTQVPFYLFGVSDSLISSDVLALLSPIEVVFSSPVGPGILSVFSGVGSWLSGAVQNISTMFWTAESGMTVLGYLAVASLAVAVILLIFYLIVGWLKFR